MSRQTQRPVAILCAWLMLLGAIAPAARAGAPADDLKQIEYKYYFRGKYQQAIEALQTYLARVDLAPADATRAREFLAASYVLGGAPEMGKEVFTRIIVADPAYPGPDPSVFKLDVMDAYAKARSDYATLAIQTAPETAGTAPPGASPAQSTVAEGKPIYKKWWLYAGVAALALGVGVAAGGGDDGGTDSRTSGTLVVGVTVH